MNSSPVMPISHSNAIALINGELAQVTLRSSAAKADALMLSLLEQDPSLITARFPDTDSMRLLIDQDCIENRRFEDNRSGGISALLFAFRHRLVDSTLHILDNDQIDVNEHAFRHERNATMGGGATLLKACITRAGWRRSEAAFNHPDATERLAMISRYLEPYLEIARALVARGAQAVPKNKRGGQQWWVRAKDPLYDLWWIHGGRDHRGCPPAEFFDVLVAAGADLNASELRFAIGAYAPDWPGDREYRDDLLQHLVDIGLDLSAPGRVGNHRDPLRPIEFALLRQCQEAFVTLIDFGADLISARGAAYAHQLDPNELPDEDADPDVVFNDFITTVAEVFPSEVVAKTRAASMQQDLRKSTPQIMGRSADAVHRRRRLEV